MLKRKAEQQQSSGASAAHRLSHYVTRASTMLFAVKALRRDAVCVQHYYSLNDAEIEI
jgi:hypothetical protein